MAQVVLGKGCKLLNLNLLISKTEIIKIMISQEYVGVFKEGPIPNTFSLPGFGIGQTISARTAKTYKETSDLHSVSQEVVFKGKRNKEGVGLWMPSFLIKNLINQFKSTPLP